METILAALIVAAPLGAIAYALLRKAPAAAEATPEAPNAQTRGLGGGGRYAK